jgi:hypothetical protein
MGGLPYLGRKYNKDSTLLTKVFNVRHVAELSAADKQLYSLLVDRPSFKSFHQAYSGYTVDKFFSETVMYHKAYNDMMELRTTLDELSEQLTRNEWVDGGAQLQKRTLDPAIQLMERLRNIYKELELTPEGQRIAAMYYRLELDAAKQMSNHILRGFLNLEAPDMLNWLASSYGLVLFRKTDIDSTSLQAFINKVSSLDYAARNIGIHEADDVVWVYLTKNADYRVSFANDTQDLLFHVNGKELSRYNWAQNDPRFLQSAYRAPIEGLPVRDLLTPEHVTRPLDMLYYITEGASGSSMFDRFTQDSLQEVYHAMPKQVFDNFYGFDHLTKPAFWSTMQFNHTVLGSTEFRSLFVPTASDNIAKTIAEATHARVKQHGTVLIYTAAFYSDMSSVRASQYRNAYGTIAETGNQIFQRQSRLYSCCVSPSQ